VAVRLVATCPDALPVAQEMLAAELAAIDRACSRFRPDAEIAGFDNAGGRPIPVSPLLLEAIKAGVRAARLTDGLVDPTLGAELAEAGYDRDFELITAGGGMPAVSRPVAAAMSLPVAVRWTAIGWDERASAVAVPEGVRLDLGATAKALAADRAAQAIAGRCDGGVLVGLGGDIAVAGEAPAGGWRIRVRDTTDDRPGVAAGPTSTVSIHAGGLATSSTAARRWCRDGESRHHIIDPLTGVPADSPWRTASVAAASCLDANIASTASILLGWSAPDWLATRGLAARLVDDAGDVHRVCGWPEDGAP